MRAPRVWGFVLRPSDLRALSGRRFVFQLTATGTLLRKPASPAPTAIPFLPPERRR